jgi:hypothetical protein
MGKMVGKTHHFYKIINKQGMLKMLCNAASLTSVISLCALCVLCENLFNFSQRRRERKEKKRFFTAFRMT